MRLDVTQNVALLPTRMAHGVADGNRNTAHPSNIRSENSCNIRFTTDKLYYCEMQKAFEPFQAFFERQKINIKYGQNRYNKREIEAVFISNVSEWMNVWSVVNAMLDL